MVLREMGRIREARESPGSRIWQRNHFGRVIRNYEELETIRNYIAENPAQRSSLETASGTFRWR
jgi:REP element-mobilizing transposase RayT